MTTTKIQHPALEQYAGTVLMMREKNGYQDSDFQALVKSGECFIWVTYASTSYGGPGGYMAAIDATPEIVAEYSAWYAKQMARVQAAEVLNAEGKVTVGREVRIVAGRKHKGKTGTVTWYGPCQFTSSSNVKAFRVGIQTAEGESFFCPADYCAVETSSGWKPCTNAREYAKSILMGATAEAVVLAMYPRPYEIGGAA
jgi:hypothetical protein